MRNQYVFLIVTGMLISSFNVTAQREIYTHPEFNSFAKDHKLIAIIPFKAIIKLRPKEMEKLSEEEYKTLLLDEGLSVQSALQTYYLKRQEQGKVNSKYQVQPVMNTNALLTKAGITQENYDRFTVEELARILGADAIVHGELNSSKPMSEGASMAMGLAIGFYGSTNTGDISLNLSDGKTGTLLWKYDKTLSRSLGSDTQTVINNLMKKATKKWPYEELRQ